MQATGCARRVEVGLARPAISSRCTRCRPPHDVQRRPGEAPRNRLLANGIGWAWGMRVIPTSRRRCPMVRSIFLRLGAPVCCATALLCSTAHAHCLPPRGPTAFRASSAIARARASAARRAPAPWPGWEAGPQSQALPWRDCSFTAAGARGRPRPARRTYFRSATAGAGRGERVVPTGSVVAAGGGRSCPNRTQGLARGVPPRPFVRRTRHSRTSTRTERAATRSHPVRCRALA